MFSKRISWNATTNKLTQALRVLQEQRIFCLDLTVSNPTQAGLTFDVSLLQQALEHPQVHQYHPDPKGLHTTRTALAQDLSLTQQFAIDPEQIILTASTSESYALLFKLLADPGDEVLVPTPSYPLFEFLAGLEALHTKPYALSYDGAWHLTRSALEQAFSSRTKAVLTVHPNNPTGHYLAEEELHLLQDFCAQNQLALLSDEVFYEFPFSGNTVRGPSACTQQKALTFTLGGFSKSLGLPQLKLGWILVSGPDELQRSALERLELIADTYLSVSTPTQLAAPLLLKEKPAFQERILERVRSNLEHIKARTRAHSAGVHPLHASGGWTLPLRLPRTHSSEEWALLLLQQEKVLLQPGYFYDFALEAVLVVSLLTPPEVLEEGLERMLSAIDRA